MGRCSGCGRKRSYRFDTGGGLGPRSSIILSASLSLISFIIADMPCLNETGVSYGRVIKWLRCQACPRISAILGRGLLVGTVRRRFWPNIAGIVTFPRRLSRLLANREVSRRIETSLRQVAALAILLLPQNCERFYLNKAVGTGWKGLTQLPVSSGPPGVGDAVGVACSLCTLFCASSWKYLTN